MKLLFVGYATVDIIEDTRHPGGAAAVMAINASTLGHTCSLITVLSNDYNGAFYQSILSTYGVNYSKSYMHSPHIPTCTIPKPHDLGSQRLWSDNGANSYIKKISVTSRFTGQFEGIFIANSHPDLAESIAEKSGRSVLYIPGPQVVLQKNYIRKGVIKKSRIVFGNEEETPFIYTQKPFENKVEAVVTTKGEKGGVVQTISGKSYEYAPTQARIVVDPTGAGDAFALGFGTSFLKNTTIENAVDAGRLLAQKVITQRGAILI